MEELNLIVALITKKNKSEINNKTVHGSSLLKKDHILFTKATAKTIQ